MPSTILNVLLIEDETLMRRVYTRVLPPDRFQLYCAASVDEAIEYLRSGKTPDVIVSDYNLGDLTGDTVLKWIDENRPGLRDRFLFCTGNPELVGSTEVFVVRKPFHLDELIEAIEAHACTERVVAAAATMR